MLLKQIKRLRRHNRIRTQISGTASVPRLIVYRSNAEIYAQLIDDEKEVTLCAASSLKTDKGSKIEQSSKVGEELAKKAASLNITKCVFDRGGFAYTWRVQALANAARENGLEF